MIRGADPDGFYPDPDPSSEKTPDPTFEKKSGSRSKNFYVSTGSVSESKYGRIRIRNPDDHTTFIMFFPLAYRKKNRG